MKIIDIFIKMDSSNFTQTDVNMVNDNIQIVCSYGPANIENKRVIILPIYNIVYLYIDGPFGAYDISENEIKIWHLCIEIDRSNHLRNVVRLHYRTYISAEEVLHKINKYLY